MGTMRMKVTPTTITMSACAVLLALNLLAKGTSVAVAQETEGPTGVCCFPTGVCGGTTLTICLDNGGVFYEGEDECPPESPCSIFGACCVPANGTCLVAPEPACLGSPYFGIWKGPDTDCFDNDFNGLPDICENTCPADLDGSGEVGIIDFLILLQLWGPCE